MDFDLLRQLTAIRGASGDESNIRDFLIQYVRKNAKNWNVQPLILDGDEFQDAFILIFGKPKTAVYAHLDTIGFTVGYEQNLHSIGSPTYEDGYQLVGSDSKGEIETELMVIEHEDDYPTLEYVFDRKIERGTNLTFRPNFQENEQFIQSPYLDNRLGVWTALKLAETLQNGAIVFSTYEEHGGNTVGFCARYLAENYQIRQALICDITWVTKGVRHGKGVAISLRDRFIPRKKFIQHIVALALQSGIDFQLEVESDGGSDGSTLQKSDLLIDWCFIGAPEANAHSPRERVHKADILSMLELYRYLMERL